MGGGGVHRRVFSAISCSFFLSLRQDRRSKIYYRAQVGCSVRYCNQRAVNRENSQDSCAPAGSAALSF
jgi:hypothetical protein